MRRLVIVCSLAVFFIAFFIAGALVTQYLPQQNRQRAIEFVKNYKGTHNSVASIQDWISVIDVGCDCSSSGKVSQSWRAEPGDRPNVWRVTSEVKTPVRTMEITFYTDMMTVWPGDENATQILNRLNGEG